MWRLYRKPRNRVARVSEERDYELHSRNTTDARLASCQTKQMKEEGRPLRTSRWLAGEDRIVIKNLRNYRKDYPDYDPLEILHSKLDPKLKRIVKTTHFYSRIAEGLDRTVCAVFFRLKYVLFPGKDIKKGKYLFEESVQLQKLYKLYGPNWTKIGAHLGRSDRSVAVKWSFSQKTKTGRWNEAEDAVLLEAVLTFKETNQCVDEDLHDIKEWPKIAKAVPGRNSYQCRAHWLFKLRNQFMCRENDLETIKWGSEENSKLVKMISDQNVCHEEDIDFDLIRKKFQENGFVVSSLQIRRQWGKLKARVTNYYIRSFEEVLDELSEIWAFNWGRYVGTPEIHSY